MDVKNIREYYERVKIVNLDAIMKLVYWTVRDRSSSRKGREKCKGKAHHFSQLRASLYWSK